MVFYTVLGVARLILALQLLDHSLLFFLVEFLPVIFRFLWIAKCLSKSHCRHLMREKCLGITTMT